MQKTKDEEIKEPYTKGMTTVYHISMTKQHSGLQKGEIVWTGNPINGKFLMIETHTPKHKNGDFGKAKVSYYLEGADTPMFDDIKKFVDHYKN